MAPFAADFYLTLYPVSTALSRKGGWAAALVEHLIAGAYPRFSYTACDGSSHPRI